MVEEWQQRAHAAQFRATVLCGSAPDVELSALGKRPDRETYSTVSQFGKRGW